MNPVENYDDVLPSIAAENAALRVRIKQEYDVSCALNDSIIKIDRYNESLKRDNEHYGELLDAKTQELTRLDEELANLTVSRCYLHNTAENLKKQYELILIEDEQRKKEQDLVRSNYETMIRNRNEIFNSNRLVVRRNNLKDRCEAARIQSAVLEEQLKDLDRQRRQLREIQNLKLKSVSVELADVWLDNKKEKEKMIVLKSRLREKEDLLNLLLSEKTKNVTSTQRSPRSQIITLPIPTPPSPMQIPLITNSEENELTKYFQKINLFKKNRSQLTLPAILTRNVYKDKAKLYAPKTVSISSPLKKNSPIVETVKTVGSNKVSDTEPARVAIPPEIQKKTFQPLNNPKDNAHSEPETNTMNEKPIQTFTLDNHSPKTDSPGKIKLTRSEKRVSPLTVPRMSPLYASRKSPMSASRLPVPVCTSSPIRPVSRIPVRSTPFKNIQNERLMVSPKQTDYTKSNQFKRPDTSSPKRGAKYARMDSHTKTIRNPEEESAEVLMHVDQLDNQMKQNLHKDSDIYEQVFNENNPIVRAHTERMQMLREGYAKKDIGKEKRDIEDGRKTKKFNEKNETGDTRYFKNTDLSKTKYHEFVKHYGKFQLRDIRKDESVEPKDFRDKETESRNFIKESISRIDEPEKPAKLPDKIHPSDDYLQYECEDSNHTNSDFLSDIEERLSKNSGMSNDNGNLSEVFSPLGNEYSVSPPGSNNFSTPFVPMGERGSMFSFGSSVNQLFGSTDVPAKNQNNGFFNFNFSNSEDQPLKLF